MPLVVTADRRGLLKKPFSNGRFLPHRRGIDRRRNDEQNRNTLQGKGTTSDRRVRRVSRGRADTQVRPYNPPSYLPGICPQFPAFAVIPEIADRGIVRAKRGSAELSLIGRVRSRRGWNGYQGCEVFSWR